MNKHVQRFSASCGAAVGLVLLAGSATVFADSLDTSRQIVNKTNNQLEKSQKRINALDDATTSLVDQYKTVVRESETYTTYNRQLTDIITSQQEELDSLNQQIDEIEVTARGVMPLMERMIATLEDFIAQDLPFLPQERADRIARLRNNMIKADLSVAEKYRKILEAYQVEIEYGKTLEAYQGELDGRQVEFVKLGRTALFYQSLDKAVFGVWNKHQQTWQTVDDSEVKQSVDVAIKIARKQRSPELLTILASKVEKAQ